MNIQSLLSKKKLEETRIEKKIIVPRNLIQLENFILSHPACFYQKYPPRKIFNLYFDTENLLSFFQHINGFSQRKKIRARWYEKFSNYEDGIFQIEIKNKENFVSEKYILRGQKKPVTGILKLKELYEIMHFAGLEEYLDEAFHYYFGCVFNSYDRSYYYSADGRVRINVDQNIFYSESPNDLSLTQKEDNIVVEFKFSPNDAEFGERVLKSFGHVHVAHSKYVKGVQTLYE